MDDLIQVSGPCDLPDTPENRKRIEKAFRAWFDCILVHAIPERSIGKWTVRATVEYYHHRGEWITYRVLFSDDASTDHLTFE